MKTIQKLNVLISGLAVALVSAFAVSCGDDPEPVPTASFTYEANGRDVTFTSTSKNAATYAWDFGDGGTSTDANPTHTYEVYGDYTVKLKVTGPGGEATSLPDNLTLAKTSAVVIDGNFDDWANIPVNTELGAGTLSKVKVDYDALKIYFYVEGTADMQGFFDLYLNVDNDFNTAFSTPHWIMGTGSEYLLEGNFAVDHDAPLYGYDTSHGDNTFFDFNVEAPVANIGSGFLASSDLKTVGSGKAIEFSVLRATLNGLSADGFTYGIEDLLNWGLVGSAPEANTETSVTSFVDLTK